MAKIGYVRVSTAEQNEARQEIIMQELGVDRVYTEKITGKHRQRPQLNKMMEELQPGDMVMVESISRFARNTRDLLMLVDKLGQMGVEFISKKENFDTTTPNGKLMLTIFAALAEWEREIILQRQAEGIAAKKAKDGYSKENHIGRKRDKVDEKLWWELFPLVAKKEMSALEMSKYIGLPHRTTCRRVAECKAVLSAGATYYPNAVEGQYMAAEAIKGKVT